MFVVETRIWNTYTRDTFELLDKSESTLQVPVFVAIDNYTVPDSHKSALILIGWIRIQNAKNDQQKIRKM